MRGWLVALAFVAGCKNHSATKAKVALAVPEVKVATVLADDTDAPPVLVLVDDSDVARMAVATTWADLDAHQLSVAARPGSIPEIAHAIRATSSPDRSPLDVIKYWNEGPTSHPDAAKDDPPPPEEDEEEEEEAEEEQWGSGFTSEPDLGKLGKKDSDRAEGQYRMRKDPDDPKRARERAIARARAAGVLGGRAGGPGLGLPLGRPNALPNVDGTPARVAEVEGNVMRQGLLERLRALIVIAPNAKATRLIDVIRETGGAIAVTHDHKVRALNLQFGLDEYRGPYSGDLWLEARVSTAGIVVEAVPGTPARINTLDELAAAVEEARNARRLDSKEPVDVLVDADVDVQRLTDVLVVLETAGVHTIGLGPAPSSEELARRGRRTARISVGQPNVQGELAKSVVRKFVKMNLPGVRACYEKALVGNPLLAGVVSTQFFILPGGKVATALASGVDPTVASCIAHVLEAIVFPSSGSDVGTQVNYPFVLWP